MLRKRKDFRIAVVDPTEDCPCAQVADISIVGDYHDMKAIEKLAEFSDVITYEFENIDAGTLKWLTENAYVPQGAKLLEMTQNRVTEKEGITRAGVEVAPYAVIRTMDDIYENISGIGYPAVLKTASGGYDGKGQFVIETEADIAKADEIVKHGTCVLEKWIPFEKEISVIIYAKRLWGNGCFSSRRKHSF